MAAEDKLDLPSDFEEEGEESESEKEAELEEVQGKEDAEEEEDDEDFDFDALAEHAVSTSEARRRVEPKELSLDIGLGPQDLYLTPSASSSKCFDTTSAAGKNTIRAKDFAGGCSVEAPRTQVDSIREVRGIAVKPLDNSKEEKKQAKKDKEDKLEKWFGMRKRKLTPELEQELKAIKLRAYYDPKRFYKGNDSKELPKYFAIATEVGGGMSAVGERTKTRDVHARSGRSFLNSILQDAQAQEWTSKRHREVFTRAHANHNSGHGNKRAKADKAKSKHRGGNWKKTTRS